MQEQIVTTHSAEATIKLGSTVGAKLRGGEIFEFVSDLGGGKTTFVRGLAEGFGSNDPVASPSFTISYVYGRPDGKELHHFDFYRLEDPGIVASELAEVEGDENVVVAVEWGELVHNVLPDERILVSIANSSETDRVITFTYPPAFSYLFEDVKQSEAA